MANQSKEYPSDSVVERAIQICGGKTSDLLYKMYSSSGTKYSRQNLNTWRNKCAFSIDVILIVHRITRIPMAELLHARLNPRDIKKEAKEAAKKSTSEV